MFLQEPEYRKQYTSYFELTVATKLCGLAASGRQQGSRVGPRLSTGTREELDKCRKSPYPRWHCILVLYVMYLVPQLFTVRR